MKKLLFLLPVLALATVFTFCTKDNPLSDTTGVPGVDKPVTSRAIVTVTSSSTTQQIRVCNMVVNSTPCVDCFPASISTGSEVGTTIENDIPAGTKFSVTNISGSPMNIAIFGPNNYIEFPLQPGACEIHGLDNNNDVF